MFEIVRRLFGIRVVEEQGVPRLGSGRSSTTTSATASTLIGAFYADWYPRENKRGGAWMDALLTGIARDGSARAARRADLRQPDPAGGRQAVAADAPRSRDHLPRVRPPAAPSAEPGGECAAWRAQRRVGLRRAAVADHGELVLGARGARPVRAALRDRRADPATSCSRRCASARTFRAANTQMRQLGFGVVDLALHIDYSTRDATAT